LHGTFFISATSKKTILGLRRFDGGLRRGVLRVKVCEGIGFLKYGAVSPVTCFWNYDSTFLLFS
jgi:hypothetical protein